MTCTTSGVIRLRPRSQPARCPLCHAGADDATQVCRGCQASYHADCLEQLGQGTCAVLSCGTVVADSPQRAKAPWAEPTLDPHWSFTSLLTATLGPALILVVTAAAEFAPQLRAAPLAIGGAVLGSLLASMVARQHAREAANDPTWRWVPLLLVSALMAAITAICIHTRSARDLGLLAFATSGITGLIGWGHLLRRIDAWAAERWPWLRGPPSR